MTGPFRPPMGGTQTDIANAIINRYAPLSIPEILRIEVGLFRHSPFLRTADLAHRYYRNDGDIGGKKRTYMFHGQPVEHKHVSNVKMHHNYFRDLVDQKVQYLLSNDWSVEDEAAAEVFDDDFRLMLQRTAKDAVQAGIGWIFVYPESDEVDGKDKIKFKRIEPVTVIPLWADNDHTKLDVVINLYTKVEYTAMEKELVEFAQWWDKDGVKTYLKENATFTLIEETPHFSTTSVTMGEEGETTSNSGYNWARLPFVPVKYNSDELSLLVNLKSFIDEADRDLSQRSDILADSLRKLKVVTGAAGTDISDFSRNVRNFEMAILPDGGDVKEVGSSVDVEASIQHQGELRSKIYDFGRGVDTLADVGANASGESKKYIYSKLDLDCNDLEAGVLVALRQLMWFLNNGPVAYNVDEKTRIKFKRNTITNESTMIADAQALQGIEGVTTRTVLSVLPMVEDVDAELAAAEEETAKATEAQAKILAELDATPFATTTTKNGDGDGN